MIFVGDGVKNFASRALPDDRRDDATLAKMLPVYAEAYGKNWANKTRPYAGVPELLDALFARGLKVVVYSNKPDEFTQATVKTLLGKWPFDAIVGARENWPHKPDPSAALDIARRLDISPADFVYVGDTNTDMQTATSAGMYPVGALWGFRTADELKSNGAKLLAAHPQDVLKVLE